MSAPSDAPADADRSAAIRTFLIADIRGYTVFTHERGDEAAARLAGKFAALARALVEAHAGSLLELRGDEALAVFDSARQAIRAAVALQLRFVEETVADPTVPLAVASGWMPARPSRSTAAIGGALSIWLPGCAAWPDRARYSQAGRLRTWRGGSRESDSPIAVRSDSRD